MIPIIDLFAGPGGLGEGFSAYRDDNSKRRFTIGLSIEMNPHAHQTLELRAFIREFSPSECPLEYYEYLEGKISRADLFNKFPKHKQLKKKRGVPS